MINLPLDGNAGVDQVSPVWLTRRKRFLIKQ